MQMLSVEQSNRYPLILTDTGGAKCRGRTPIQGYEPQCSSFQKNRWHCNTLCLHGVDRDGKHSEISTFSREDWEEG